jgi:hypothetical protein
MLDSFQEGFAEGRQMAQGEIETTNRVTFLHNGTKMREKDYADLKELWDDVLTFLSFGPGARVEIEVVDVTEHAVSTNEIEQG